MEVILKCLEDVYDDVPVIGESGEVIDIETKCVKRGVITRITVESESIIACKEHFNNKGKIYKNRCVANINGFGNVMLKHSFEEICKIKNFHKDNFIVYGFTVNKSFSEGECRIKRKNKRAGKRARKSKKSIKSKRK